MKYASRRNVIAGAGLVATAAVAPGLSQAPAASVASSGSGESTYNVLVFSKTAGFRHGSIPDGIVAIEKLGVEHGFTVTATEDAAVFNDTDLAAYAAVLWLSTTGDVLDAEQQAAFERYIQGGGGYVGVHAASDTEYDWPWYGGLVGAYFAGHPAQQTATVKVRGRSTAATAGLPRRWTRWDEWYSFRDRPADSIRVLADLDERSYDPGQFAMGDPHPIAWCHRYDGGRAFYTGMGHTSESFTEPAFLSHLLGGIEMVAGAAPFRCEEG
ncbi:ThuA domain-containing protein [Nocardioides sp.]|uniref:ThuA domain-containing protein n=1 Tax=Nocardioides sp. TaxID=35761 RepID=UPI0019BD27F9|nr:ThuA domain-containing protein [Nocardioides sp.]MBC7279562.1 ThuA domain-containing protein [Nocardioides sp.]